MMFLCLENNTLTNHDMKENLFYEEAKQNHEQIKLKNEQIKLNNQKEKTQDDQEFIRISDFQLITLIICVFLPFISTSLVSKKSNLTFLFLPLLLLFIASNIYLKEEILPFHNELYSIDKKLYEYTYSFVISNLLFMGSITCIIVIAFRILETMKSMRIDILAPEFINLPTKTVSDGSQRFLVFDVARAEPKDIFTALLGLMRIGGIKMVSQISLVSVLVICSLILVIPGCYYLVRSLIRFFSIICSQNLHFFKQ